MNAALARAMAAEAAAKASAEVHAKAAERIVRASTSGVALIADSSFLARGCSAKMNEPSAWSVPTGENGHPASRYGW